MPTNVTPEYRRAEQRYRAATDLRERIEILEEMLRIMPKHKGTDKLQADLKTRLSKLRNQSDKKGGSRHSFAVPREGAGQIALVGAPNSGKSSILDRLTHAEPKIGDYPFTTREPLPGMAPFENIAFQLIDLPPLSREHVDYWVYDMIRRADLVWLVASNENSLDELEEVLPLLEAKKIHLYPPGVPTGPSYDGWTTPPTLLAVTGADADDARENLVITRELIEVPWPVFLVSSTAGTGFEELERATFEGLNIVRVFTKEPSKPPDMEKPFTLKRGSTVVDLARTIHKDVAEQFKFARIWGTTAFDGQQVQNDHVLEEGDVVELHHK